MVIRLAEERDIQLLKDIYNYEVENTTATFDLVPRTLEDRTEWFLEHKQGNSILIVTDIDGIAVGYASFSQYRTKDAYKSTVELSVYVNHNYRGMGIAKEQIQALKKDIAPLMPNVQIIYTKQQLEEVIENNYIGLLLYFEGLEPVEENIQLLEQFYNEGVRGASLTWSRTNSFATGSCKACEHENKRGHLTYYGITAVKKLSELGMFIDISHLNDDGISDISSLTIKPYCATHSNCRTLCDNYRNLTDKQIAMLSEKGCIIGINAYKYLNIKESLINSKDIHNFSEEEFINAMAGQIIYLYNNDLSDSICFGFDLCDMLTASQTGSIQKISRDDTLSSHRHAVLLTAKLMQNGIPEKDIIKIIGGNFIEYIKRFLPEK